MNAAKRMCTCLLAASTLAALDGSRAETFTPAPTTSFNCATTTAVIEKLVCRDPQLLRMEKELTRLYRLVLTDVHAVPPPDKVVDAQQFWALERNQCAAQAQPKSCTLARYAERAYQLRQGSAIARTKDPDRLTDGPVAFRCAGLSVPLAATFFRARPDVVYLKWGASSASLIQMPSSADQRYTGTDGLGEYSFWSSGNDALFQKPGSGETHCTAEPTP
ncbi:Membrane-bound lysozyme-inhibitor of c-type lysozyme [Pseudomonas sp. ok272]|uniref:MliC family protein n=1 Tax=unclassified Pseudomonas TaxID=196821 RepID=UPI0008C8AA21|nr:MULTISPECIES: MliC family protein [unclassified Pseudomonas]SEN23695.1 Membrane-bound lysozyme-inhibitor of c-type lysozyme [Pseudomonas sp. ok272]SFN14908.1 Membrane-bound lysozyme-inhibitor of c-type lysozyme [Pseudomonas sp. ok602]